MHVLNHWQAPHDFALVPIEGDPLAAPRDVITYGTLLPDLLDGDFGERHLRRLARNVGLWWVATLADRLSEDLHGENATPSNLTVALNERFGITGPAGHVGLIDFADPVGQLPVAELRAFSKQHGRQLDSFFEGLIRDYTRLLVAGTRSDDITDSIETWWQAGQPQLAFVGLRRRSDGTKLWAFRFADLRERLWFELFELAQTDAAEIRTCAKCGRFFVAPGARQATCRRWIFDGRPPYAVIGQCYSGRDDPDALPDRDAREAHRRRYKALKQQEARWKQRCRAGHAEADDRLAQINAELDALAEAAQGRGIKMGRPRRPPRVDIEPASHG